MKGKNSAAVVDRQENKARSKHRRVLMNSQNKTKLKNGEGSLERSERNMDEDPILNDATTVSRRNTSQGTTCNEQRALRTCGRIYKRQERDDRIRITANFKYYQDTHGQFKARMVAQFGERFFIVAALGMERSPKGLVSIISRNPCDFWKQTCNSEHCGEQ